MGYRIHNITLDYDIYTLCNTPHSKRRVGIVRKPHLICTYYPVAGRLESGDMKISPEVITAIMGGLGILIASYTSHRKSRAEIEEGKEMRKESTAIKVLTKQVNDLTERVDGLYTINQELREINASQKFKIQSLELENSNLLKLNLEYENQISNLEKRVKKLETELDNDTTD